MLKTPGGVKKDLGRSVASHLDQHPRARICTSLSRAGQVNAVQILAAWGDSRAAYQGPDAIVAFADVAPVTKASRRMRGVSYRWVCNARFARRW